MTRQWYVALATLLLAITLVGGLVVLARHQSTADRSPGSTLTGSSRPDAPDPTAPAATPTPQPSTAPTGGPAADTVHLADRYRARYAGRYVDWDDLLAAGTKLPRRSDGCRTAWRATTKDAALDWSKAGYLCLDRLTGKGFKPQGVGGSSSARGYRIGERPAAERNLVLVSSYSSKAERGLRFPNQPGSSDATRLTVLDLDRHRYNQIELVRPVGTDSLAALDSHGSGVVWVGQYLYSSTRGSLWMYNADDLMEIDGRYVLPAVARWRVQGVGGLSSLAVDRTHRTARLIGISYSQTQTAWTQSFQLDSRGLLRATAARGRHELRLVADFGPGPRSVRSIASAAVPGTNYQGIGRTGSYRVMNSSSLMLDGRRHGDNVVIMKKSVLLARFSMPRENVESLYLDERRNRYVTITEHGRQFLFWLPLDHLIDAAER